MTLLGFFPLVYVKPCKVLCQNNVNTYILIHCFYIHLHTHISNLIFQAICTFHMYWSQMRRPETLCTNVQSQVLRVVPSDLAMGTAWMSQALHPVRYCLLFTVAIMILCQNFTVNKWSIINSFVMLYIWPIYFSFRKRHFYQAIEILRCPLTRCLLTMNKSNLYFSQVKKFHYKQCNCSTF